MYMHKLLLLFSLLVVYIVVVLLFIYKSSEDLKRNKLLPITKAERSYVNTGNYNTSNRTTVSKTVKNNKENNVKLKNYKTILYWNLPYWAKSNINYKIDEYCGGCTITDNKTLLEVDKFDAIVFHQFYINDKTQFPSKRKENQLYVMGMWESPKSERTFKLPENFYNLSNTYRRDSDIYEPYYTTKHVLNKLKNKYKGSPDFGLAQTLKQKTELVSWVASNCNSSSGAKTRMNIVNKMVESGIKMDLRGSCFPKNPPESSRNDKKMLEFFGRSKFYLAFENSYHCKDYITEKVYRNAFLSGTVPIVWGSKKEDYEAVLPKHSFIFLEDYASNFTILNTYLNYLDRNDTAYGEYLNWRLLDPNKVYGHKLFTGRCSLCRRLQDGSFSEKSKMRERSSDWIRKWYYESEDTECWNKTEHKYFYSI